MTKKYTIKRVCPRYVAPKQWVEFELTEEEVRELAEQLPEGVIADLFIDRFSEEDTKVYDTKSKLK